MKGQYKFTQTVHTGPQRKVAITVKHDYEGAVPMTVASHQRIAAYLRQNGCTLPAALVSPNSLILTPRQRRQLRRMENREHSRSLRPAA